MRNDHKTNAKHTADAKATLKASTPIVNTTTTPVTIAKAPASEQSTTIAKGKEKSFGRSNGNNGDIITIITSNAFTDQQQQQRQNSSSTPSSPPPPTIPNVGSDASTRITIIEHCPQPLKAKSRTSSRLVRFLKSTKQRKRDEKQQQLQQQQTIATILNGHTNETATRTPLNSQTIAIATAKTITTNGGTESSGGVGGGAGGSTGGSSSNGSSNSSATNIGGAWQYCDVSHCISFQDNIADVHHRKGRRLNGLQLPLHPLQLFGWLVLVLFGLAAYWLLIPSFAAEWQGPLYGLITGLYIVHVVSHLAALLLDPADRELRRLHRNDRIVPEFDRTKHAHVIENGRCHLCNIRTTSQRTKHCSVCNKCVGKFDHHCKWLNHCVGSRNYVAFLMCVVSAVIATLVIVAAVLAQFAFYYLQPQWLRHSADSEISEIAVRGGGDIETIAFVLSENASGTNGTNGTNRSEFDGVGEAVLNITGILLEPTVLEDFIGNITLSTLSSSSAPAIAASSATTLSTTTLMNETLSSINVNLSATTDGGRSNSSSTLYVPTSETDGGGGDREQQSTPPVAGIAGIGVSDTIFLVLLGFLGLLAAITAGLLLHLCFFHIYISFLGLTTYEYIRNHRQAQEAKAKLSASTMAAAQQSAATAGGSSPLSAHSTPPSKQAANGCSQIYCCSSLRHPNAMASSGYGSKHAPTSALTNHGGLHCCADYREYHQTALKTYYMCSLLEEQDKGGCGVGADGKPVGRIAHISGTTNADDESDIDADVAHLRTFHCCSSFAASATQRKLSTVTTKATLVSDLEAALSARRSYLQYTEQCTFCTFRIRSPSLSAKRTKSAGSGGSTSSCSSATSTRSISRTQSGEFNIASRSTSAASTKVLSGGGGGGVAAGATGSGTVATVGVDTHPRCCMKAISKQQRWRRKWNCCSSVPDSPDVPNDIIATLALRHQQQQQQQHQELKSTNATEIPVHFIRSVNGGGGGGGGCSPPPSATMKLNVAAATATSRTTRNSRTWPVARFRHMMRMFNRYRRPRCRHHHHHHPQQQQPSQQLQHHHQHTIGGGVNAAALMAEQVKQNQIRPLQLRSGSGGVGGGNGCQQPHYDSSSPMPSSTTATLTPSSERSVTTPNSSLGGGGCSVGMQSIETILPTSVIRDDSAVTYMTGMAPALPPVTITLPPALPPPTRRKIPNPTDLEELAETLAFAAAASHNGNGNGGGGSSGGSGGNRLPALQNVYRRQRRKHFLRTRSPTLSPIHESGLSNPTSPQPGRHHSGNLNSNNNSSNTTISAGCSPVATSAAVTVVNSLCGTSGGEHMRKTASNSSLSSNSSSSN